MLKVGITEGGDPSVDLRWADSTCDINIIITKRLSNELILGLIKKKANTILHLTCTGRGGSGIEPGVPSMEELLKDLSSLVDLGFPVSQVVLRIDPIIPDEVGVSLIRKIFSTMVLPFGITRVRYSICDFYKTTYWRYIRADIKIPDCYPSSYSNLLEDGNNYMTADEANVEKAIRALLLEAIPNNVQLETCAMKYAITPKIHQVGCISKRDTEILFNQDSPLFELTKKSRKTCLCESDKIELIPNRHRCGGACLYCFWRD